MKEVSTSQFLDDPRSTEELIEIALKGEDEEISRAVVTLQLRGNREIFEAAKALFDCLNPEKRILGASILSQLGVPERTFREESIEFLLDVLPKESDPQVLRYFGFALGELRAKEAVPALVSLKNHLSADVRYGVVCGLMCQEDDRAIETLIELSRDEDLDVRNWATFGLGSMVDTDTKAIREALFQRLTSERNNRDVEEMADDEYEVYGEALVGLARRKDERAIAPLLQELNDNRVGYLAVEAAEEIGDPRLYDALISLKGWWDENTSLLEDAIVACDPKKTEKRL